MLSRQSLAWAAEVRCIVCLQVVWSLAARLLMGTSVLILVSIGC